MGLDRESNLLRLFKSSTDYEKANTFSLRVCRSAQNSPINRNPRVKIELNFDQSTLASDISNLAPLKLSQVAMLPLREKDGFKILRSALLNPASDTECEYYFDALIIADTIDGQTTIVEVGETSLIAQQRDWKLEEIPKSEGIILPAFYDIHFHWVQDDVRQKPKISLLEWLEAHTFPEEARFSDKDYCEAKAAFFWSRIISTGTIGGLCYSSIHSTALDAAMRHAPAGFMIGNVLMDMSCPDYLMQSSKEAIQSVHDGANKYESRYCVTPRFAPTTSPEVMSEGARVAKEKNLFTQTHLCETTNEIEYTLNLYRDISGFEDISSYTEIYARCNMLGPKTVMGHSIHFEQSEWDMISESNTAIASCPTSNAPIQDLGLGSGLFDYEKAEDQGIRWALASDIGGGPFLCMFDVIDSFERQNRYAGKSGDHHIKALYRSTQAGADILGLGDSRGNLSKGKRLDCIQCIATRGIEPDATAASVLKAIISQAPERGQFEALVSATVVNGEILYES